MSLTHTVDSSSLTLKQSENNDLQAFASIKDGTQKWRAAKHSYI